MIIAICAVPEDGGRMHLYTILKEAWPRPRAKRGYGPSAYHTGYIGYSRQIVGEPLHP
jgi:hypothetical protein